MTISYLRQPPLGGILRRARQEFRLTKGGTTVRSLGTTFQRPSGAKVLQHFYCRWSGWPKCEKANRPAPLPGNGVCGALKVAPAPNVTALPRAKLKVSNAGPSSCFHVRSIYLSGSLPSCWFGASIEVEEYSKAILGTRCGVRKRVLASASS